MSNLFYLIQREIGGNPSAISERIIKDVDLYIYNPGDMLDLSLMKNIIWDSADWPLFINPHLAELKRLVDHIIPDRLAIDAMRMIEADNPEYRFNREKSELIFTPIPKEKLF